MLRVLPYLIIFLILTILFVKVALPLIQKAFGYCTSKYTAKRNHAALWVIEEDPQDQAIQVQLVKPGEEPLFIGEPVPVSLPHWEYDEVMAERRVEAEDKLETVNRPLLRLSR
jgi:hypothetical protein